MTIRSRFTASVLLLLVALIRGEFTLHLSNGHLRNAIVVRINGTAECPTVSDFFPDPRIALSESQTGASVRQSPGQGTNATITWQTEPVLVTMYNSREDRRCDSGRREIVSSPNQAATSIRVITLYLQHASPEPVQWIGESLDHSTSDTETQWMSSWHRDPQNGVPQCSYPVQVEYIEEINDPNLELSVQIDERGARTHRLLGNTPHYGIGGATIDSLNPETSDPEDSSSSSDVVVSQYGIGSSVSTPQGPDTETTPDSEDKIVSSSATGNVFHSPVTNMGLGDATSEIPTKQDSDSAIQVLDSLNPETSDAEDSSSSSDVVVSQYGIGSSISTPQGPDTETTPDGENKIVSNSEMGNAFHAPVTNMGQRGSTSEIPTKQDSDSAIQVLDYELLTRHASCSPVSAECCDNGDCLSKNTICIDQTCVDDGNPRITLSWSGDDDVELYVVTPTGSVLSLNNPIDEVTGGRVGKPRMQAGMAHHVENVYFPMHGGPPGTYQYYVRPVATMGSSDTWTVAVSDEHGPVARHTGSGFSSVFSYEKISSSVFEVARDADFCDSTEYECCQSSQCQLDGEVCLNRNCVDDGNPRFTLTWVGDDDLDLYVETPSGQSISYKNEFDSLSGGRFGEDAEQYGFGYHVENVFFPMEDAPYGNYRFYVHPLITVGVESDTWTLTVTDQSRTVAYETGKGASDEFVYTRRRGDPTSQPVLAPQPTSRPVEPTLAPVSPVEPPSRAPQLDSGCNAFFDECCQDSDCPNSRDLCEQRICVRDGNPRFSLIWDGDDNLDIFVVTPTGVEISVSNTFDIISRGILERDSAQNEHGKHVESVSFPTLGTATGEYTFGVRATNTVASSDSWVLEVYDDGELVRSETGSGDSMAFIYNRETSIDGPQRPRPSPPRCVPGVDECCFDSDCETEGETCVQRTCISEGSPRITLRWIGDDDLDLIVETPGGVEISNTNQVDPVTGGHHENDFPQSVFGFHVESVSFPAGSSPAGSYDYYVRSSATRGTGPDVWHISVYDGGEEVAEQVGIGDSREFVYERLDGGTPTAPSTPTTPTLPPSVVGHCTPESNECCTDSDCGAGEACDNRNCVNEGNPRFTLTWVGDDDFDLFVNTPDGTFIYYGNRNDRSSGGIFGEDALQSSFGFHAESVYFPITGSPSGTYTAVVRLASRRGTADSWTLRVYEGSVQQVVSTGSGDSTSIRYIRSNQPTLPPSPTAPTPTAPAPVTDRPPQPLPPTPPRDCPAECCAQLECTSPDEICVQRTCIKEGTPRFTLSWTGNDDLSLAVITPGGRIISYLNPTDSISGGVFGEDSSQDEFGFHVESIVFPTRGGPGGQYSYYVGSDTIRGTADRWALRVYVDGQLVAWQTGSGDSRTYTYQYDGSANPTTPTPAPVPTTLAPISTRAPVPPTNDYCQTDNDCIANVEVCVQETCIDEGNPRFTLKWVGNDDYDFFVQTPNGFTISAGNPYDSESGGIFGEPGVQSTFDRFVENIYFPLGGGPSGTYTYYIQSTRTQGSEDTWEVSVNVGGEEQAVRSGNGNSAFFTFEYVNDSPTQAPGATPTLPPATVECQNDGDCQGGNLCVQNTCIDNGNPRITLTWTGDDDLDLVVQTPTGGTISGANPTDPTSSGRFGEESVQDAFGKHVENVYFPTRGPPGTYLFSVASYQRRGGDDIWTVQAFVDQQIVASYSGLGSSATFTFDLDNESPTAAPTTDSATCNSAQEDCCSSSDCLGNNEICTQRTCIDEGNPRFTLTWTGDDDLDLSVLTPLNTVVSVTSDFDAQSGGRFGESGDQFEFGRHVENVFFPTAGAPFGLYTYNVKSFLPTDDHDYWTVTVHINGQSVTSTSGTGDSATLNYLYNGAPPTSAPVLPPPTPAPVPGPTPNPSECDVQVEECCTDGQCITGLETCVNRNCIDIGNPLRFTLSWAGDDDLDLQVTTPLGTEISFVNPLDSQSGGVYGEDGSQFEPGRHVENVYFSNGAPEGLYIFSVSSFTPRSTDDSWTVSVSVNNVEVVSYDGSGDSIRFAYDYEEGNLGPTPAPGGCDTATEECCLDSDCLTGQLCVQQTCISRGNPRFTLTWTGDDDLDLAVVTPLATTVSVANPKDDESGGMLGQSGDQLTFGQHVENIYFPLSGGPIGTYTYAVSSFQLEGSADFWTVNVYVDDVVVASQSGTGFSDVLEYDYNNGAPTPPPIETCNTATEECCANSDCPANSLCVQRICIEEGNPRFTLTWTGDDDYDLQVTPPIGKTISLYDQVDEVSGGKFGENGVQFTYGDHTENIFFPLEGGPVGSYEVVVEGVNQVGDLDTWTVEVYVDSQLVDSFTGTGTSSSLIYDYARVVLTSTEVRGCSGTNECCSDRDCHGSDEVCVQGRCIPEGNPRFTLSWNGDDDLDLTVYTPHGNEISYYRPRDMYTQGVFQESTDQSSHLESVYFPLHGGPTGAYRYKVSSFHKSGKSDSWTAKVFMKGVEVASQTGEGDSPEFVYDYVDPSEEDEPDDNQEETEPEDDPDETEPEDNQVVPATLPECQAHSDCPLEASICVLDFCLTGGPLQFTLLWTGSELLTMSVLAPGSDKYRSSEGRQVGLESSWERQESNDGLQLRHLYFIPTPNTGRYTYSVSFTEDSEDLEQSFRVLIHQNGEEVMDKTGILRGSPSFSTFEYQP